MTPPSLRRQSLYRQPWYSTLEWMDVYQGIFSHDATKCNAAIARISLWEMKSNRVPIAVSLTRLFIKALKADQEGTRSTTELQLLYGAAIIRFVNSHVDLEQNRVYAQSISTIACDLGIPSEIVDCRHRITHQEMPTLDLLRHTASLCFDFLRVKYWIPQADLVRSRLASISQSKYLASGLVALFQDLENLAPPDDLEASLQQLSEEISPSRRSPSMRNLLLAAADVAGLKQKDAMRILKRNGIPGYFSQPAFVNASAWCQQIRKTFPKCMEFLENLLYQCPHENVTLSFLKDLVLIAYDSEINPAAVLAVFWILSRASPNLTFRLISRIIHSLISTPSQSSRSLGLPMGSTIGCSDFKCFSSSSSSPSSSMEEDSSNHYLGSSDGVGQYCYDAESFSLWLRAMDVSSEEEQQLTNDLDNHFGYQSRLVCWLRTLLLLPSSSFSSDDDHIRTDQSQFPFCLELLLHLFCDPPAHSSLSSVKSSSPNQSVSSSSLSGLAGTTKDLFCQRLLQCINTTHSRVLTACRANIDSVARIAFKVLFVDASSHSDNINIESPTLISDTQRGLKLLLRVFEEADVRVPNGAASRLIQWVSCRMLRKPLMNDATSILTESSVIAAASNRLQRQALQRLLLPLGRSAIDNENSLNHPFLTDQFKTVLVNLLQHSPDQPIGHNGGARDVCSGNRKVGLSMSDTADSHQKLELFPPSQAALVKTGLMEIRRNALGVLDSSPVQELSTLEIPWTHPGTFPMHQSDIISHTSNENQRYNNNNEIFQVKPIVELLPQSGSHFAAPVTEILQSFTSNVNDVQLPHPRRGLKRRGRNTDMEQGEICNDDSEGCSLLDRPAKRIKAARYPAVNQHRCDVPSATERFIFDGNGFSMRDDSTSRAFRFTPLAIQQLESEIIRDQQQQSQLVDPHFDGDRLMHDWCTIQEFLSQHPTSQQFNHPQ